jgi:hypothetical protein
MPMALLRMSGNVILITFRVSLKASFFSLALQSPLGPDFTDGRTPWTSDQLVARPLPKQRTTQTQNKHIKTFTPRLGFEPTIPASDRAKTVHVLNRSAAVTSSLKAPNFEKHYI